MSSTSEKVLVTGATGFIGAHVLDYVLEKTTLEAIVVLRKLVKKEFILSKYKNDSLFQQRLRFVEVPNLLAPGAITAHLTDVAYIIHVASPFAWKVKSNRQDLIEPAIDLTKVILEAAMQSPSIKRVVFTGSFSSILNPLRGDVRRDYTYTEKDWNPLTNKFLASLYGPTAYLASKTLAEKEVWSFIEQSKPHFDAVVLCPPMVYGPLAHQVDKASDLNESSAQVYKLLGATNVPKDDTPFCDVRDVAELHVAALTEARASNQRYLLSGGGLSWQDVCDATREQYPSWSSSIPEGKAGSGNTSGLATLDATKARKDFNFEFRDWKQSIVVDTMPQLQQFYEKWRKQK